MKYRKLRIAWSVAWGMVAVLLCVMWVRSYWVTDSAEYLVPNWRDFAIGSARGYVILFESDEPSKGKKYSYSGLVIKRIPETLRINSILFESHESTCILGKIYYQSKPGWGITLTLPNWFTLLVVAGLAGVPWIRWTNRFSLRTLLIATTLVAIGLGLIVWAARS